MIVAARRAGGRMAERDALLILLAFRHGLRASELIALRWDQIDLGAGLLHISRLKRGTPSTHPIRSPELRALRAWRPRIRRLKLYDGAVATVPSGLGTPEEVANAVVFLGSQRASWITSVLLDVDGYLGVFRRSENNSLIGFTDAGSIRGTSQPGCGL